MAGAEILPRRGLRALGVALVAAAILLLAGCGAMIPPSGPDRAAALVAAYAAHVGAPDRTLGPDGDVSFGETGFYYDRAKDALFARVYVNGATIEEATPGALANYRRMTSVLNDPAVGGRYERAGGYFVLDEKREAYFLVRPFAVPATTPDQLIVDMEHLQNVAAVWTTTWLAEVARVMHGHRPPPSRNYTLDNPK